MNTLPDLKQPALYHLFGLLEGERFRVPQWADSPVFRVEHASASDEDAPRFAMESTGEAIPSWMIAYRNGGSYFVLPIPSGPGSEVGP